MMHIKNERGTTMRFIGITGGVGAGKSAILSYFAQMPDTKVMLADEIAHKLMEPGTECYNEIVQRFAGEDIFSSPVFKEEDTILSPAELLVAHKIERKESKNRPFDTGKLAQVIFSDKKKRVALNGIVHPAVKAYVKKVYRQEAKKGQLELLVLEAALLIEDHYDEICDEIWYIYTSEEIRRKRLIDSRGYSNEKINNIFKSQLSEQEFRENSSVVIDNNGTPEETFHQIENALRRIKADE